MKPDLRQLSHLTAATCAVALAASNAFGAGSDHPGNEPVGGTSAWPSGLKELVNTTNRVHGFFVNSEDIFFFAGSATDLSTFLRDYARIEGVEKHQLVLHEGVGEAKSPWDTSGRPCDWKLYACPRSWLNLGNAASRTNSVEVLQEAAADTSFILEVHFWTNGEIALDQVAVPENIEFAGDCLKNFESITNGMTRAEVEERLTMDGALQGVSPVRFVDPQCPGFKINVEFDFAKDAADQGRAIWGQDDKVIHVSRPHLDRPFRD